ncbi:MAG: glutaredoxin family protein [Pseudomonadota bacterium]
MTRPLISVTARRVRCRPTRALMNWSVLGSALLVFCSGAQALYKVVGPDGKITYSDRPPAQDAGKDKVVPLNPGNTTAPVAQANLPVELRDVAGRYPVVLYTLATPCQPCDRGRTLLKERGIPFTERQVVNPADSDVLEQRTGGRDTPVMVVGTQVNRGFSPAVWNQYLDIAGYPKTSRLPAAYLHPAPMPLTEGSSPAAPDAAASAGRPATGGRPAVPAAPSPPPPPAAASGPRF